MLFDFASGKSSPERGGEENQDSIEAGAFRVLGDTLVGGNA